MNKISTRKEKLRPAVFELLVTIINRGKGEAVVNFLKAAEVNLNVLSFGEGTAPSNLQNVLNLSQEKEVVFAIVNLADSEKILDAIDNAFLATEKYAGIAFTIPLKSMTSDAIDTWRILNRINKKRSNK